MIPKSDLSNVDDFRHRYTAQSKYSVGERIPYYYEDAVYFGIPRHALRLSKAMAEEIVDERTLGFSISLTFSGNLWDYQQKAIDNFSSIVAKGGTGIFLEAAPGSGKTVMGLKMLELLGRTALIIVPKSDLVGQWKDRILSFTNLKESDIGIVEGGKSSYNGKKIVIGLVHSIIIDRIATPEFKKYFGVVLFDECDSSVPPKTFSCAAGMFPAKYRIGMTASRTRADGLHVIFEESLAQFHIKCFNTKTLSPTVVLHYFRESSGTIPSYLKNMQRRGALISMLCSNPVRNAVIADYASRSYNSGRSTLIISDRKEQLQIIKNLLIKSFKIDPTTIGYFVRSLNGKMLKQSDKENTADKCKIILATYGMMNRGTDIPRLETLILGSIRSDMRQVSGRIERFLEDKQSPVIVDIVDTAYKETKNSAKARIQFYANRNLRVKYVR